ncbi:MAG TPA: hypothetical protein VMV72_00370 [Verrucomicrobiae bacterium]|nr:hypothetical protein [Verrucomicrobiae bacterium]
MSKREQSEDLVQVHHAHDEWEGNIIVGYLRDNGVEATLQAPPAVPPLDAMETLSGAEKTNGIFVLEDQADKARALLKDFVSTVADEQVLEEAASQKLKLDKETIGQLRTALREERQTFALLGWVSVVFLGAAALLWAIWPSWLRIGPPTPVLRWVVVILLALAAVFAGNWASRPTK